jgi:hypothetical protein
MGDDENEGLIRAELDEMFEHVRDSLADSENDSDIKYNEY